MQLTYLLFIFLMPTILWGQQPSKVEETAKRNTILVRKEMTQAAKAEDTAKINAAVAEAHIAEAIKASKKAKEAAKRNAALAKVQMAKATEAMEAAKKTERLAVSYCCNKHHDLYLYDRYSYLQSKKELEKKQSRYQQKKQSSEEGLEPLASTILVLKEKLAKKEIKLKNKGLSLAQSFAIKSIRATDIELKVFFAKEAYHLHTTSDGSLMDYFIYEAIYNTLSLLEESHNDKLDFNLLDQLPEGYNRIGRIRSIKVGKEPTSCYTISSDRLLLKWKFDSDSTSAEELSNQPKVLSSDIMLARTLDISPDGKQLARAGDGDKIWITSTKSGRVLKKLKRHKKRRIWALKYSPDGKTIITAEEDGAGGTFIHSINIEDGSTSIIERMPYRIASLAISNDGKYLAATGKSSEVWVWNLTSQCHDFILNASSWEKNATAVAFSPDKNLVAVGYQSGTLIVWDLNKINVDSTYTPKNLWRHKAYISDLEFNKDGTLLLAGSFDRTATIWTMYDKKYNGNNMDRIFPYLDPSYIPVELKNHKDWVTAVAFSPDNTKVITGTASGKLKVWEIDINSYVNKINELFVPTKNSEDTYKIWSLYIGIDTPDKSLSRKKIYLDYLKSPKQFNDKLH